MGLSLCAWQVRVGLSVCLCAERWGSVKSLHACRREGGVMKFMVARVRVGRGADATQRGTRPHGMSTQCGTAACDIGA